jgi:hypothetical protein
MRFFPAKAHVGMAVGKVGKYGLNLVDPAERHASAISRMPPLSRSAAKEASRELGSHAPCMPTSAACHAHLDTAHDVGPLRQAGFGHLGRQRSAAHEMDVPSFNTGRQQFIHSGAGRRDVRKQIKQTMSHHGLVQQST